MRILRRQRIIIGGESVRLQIVSLSSSPYTRTRAGRYAEEGLRTLHSDVVNAAGRIIKRKGYTNWALGLAVTSIVKCILRDDRHILPLSVPAKGHYGITQDVHLSLPAMLGSDGVQELVRVPMSEEEEEQLRQSARVLAEVQDTIVYKDR